MVVWQKNNPHEQGIHCKANGPPVSERKTEESKRSEGVREWPNKEGADLLEFTVSTGSLIMSDTLAAWGRCKIGFRDSDSSRVR